MARPTDPEALAQAEVAFAGSSESGFEISFRRKGGGIFWAAVFISPVRDKAGNIVEHFASFVDLTEHKQEKDRLRFLLDELNHRTQNTLATVQALAVQTLRGAADKEAVAAFEGRILALSKAHGLLGGKHWEAVSLRDVIDRILQPFGLNDRRAIRFSVEGDDVRLQPKNALTLAMVFHELATNAAKHGALSNGEPGKIDIAWQIEPTARPINYLGLPVLEIPAGQSRYGMPIGLQLVGRPFGDETVIALGRAFQTATNHHRRIPDFPCHRL